MQDNLRLIIAKSPSAYREAMKTLQAIGANSPIVQTRYNHTVQMALDDPEAEFTAEERAQLAEAVTVEESNDLERLTLYVRSEDAKAIRHAAVNAGKRLSEYLKETVLERVRKEETK